VGDIANRTNVSTIDLLPGSFEGLVFRPAAYARGRLSPYVIPAKAGIHCGSKGFAGDSKCCRTIHPNSERPTAPHTSLVSKEEADG
jgi:hypothetical protein